MPPTEEYELHLTYSPHLMPLFCTGALLCVLLVVAWRERRSSTAAPFALTLAALLVWTFGYAFEIAAVERDAKLVWANIQFLAIAPLPVL
jgi:hypothetical protein